MMATKCIYFLFNYMNTTCIVACNKRAKCVLIASVHQQTIACHLLSGILISLPLPREVVTYLQTVALSLVCGVLVIIKGVDAHA